MAGGLARRAHIVESIRKDDPSVLLLDSGGNFGNEREAAELSLKAMAIMGYDALNLGAAETGFGMAFLEQTRSRVPFPYLAANLLYEGKRLPWTMASVILNKGGVKVAVVGLFDPACLSSNPGPDHARAISVEPPEAALKRLLPDLKTRADLVVLLSQYGMRETQALVTAVKGIDVAISSGLDNASAGPAPENTLMLHTGYLGRELGLLKIRLEKKRRPAVIGSKRFLLDQTVADHAQIANLMDAFKRADDERKAQQAKKQLEKQEKQRAELMEGLKLSPQEFMERFQQEQMKKGEKR